MRSATLVLRYPVTPRTQPAKLTGRDTVTAVSGAFAVVRDASGGNPRVVAIAEVSAELLADFRKRTGLET